MTSMVAWPWPSELPTDLVDWVGRPDDHTPMRLEVRLQDGWWVLRAELPGFDPDQHIRVSAEHGRLTIVAEREPTGVARGASEFRYGTFRRSVRLPEGADPAKSTAHYTDGILDIAVPVRKSTNREPIRIGVARS